MMRIGPCTDRGDRVLVRDRVVRQLLPVIAGVPTGSGASRHPPVITGWVLLADRNRATEVCVPRIAAELARNPGRETARNCTGANQQDRSVEGQCQGRGRGQRWLGVCRRASWEQGAAE
jgi:hypothetical protein